MTRRRGAAVLGLALVAWPAAALSQTLIVPDGGSVRALGTTAVQAGNTITIDGGTRAGANLFHSFSQFSLGAGATAQWVRSGGDAAAINNVINRVTGGEVSAINGTLDSTGLPNASFFFINPAGIVFGAGARVNVPAAAYFSTAAELRFADGGRFAVATPTGSTLSMAAPESFGFVGGQGTIDVDAAGAGFAPASARLSFSGSDVRFGRASPAGEDRVVVSGLDLVGFGAGAGTLRLSDPLAAAATGSVTLRNSGFVVSSGDAPSGAFRVAGGDVSLDGMFLVSDAGGQAHGSDIGVRASQLSISGVSIFSSARAGGAGGDVSFTADRIDLSGGFVASITTTDAAGGRIALNADTLTVRGGALLASTNSGGGVGGDIALAATSSLLIDSGLAISSTLGTARGGAVTVRAPSIQLFAANLTGTASGPSRPGDVVIDGGVVEISGGTFGANPGSRSDSGAISVTASSSLSVLGGSFVASSASDRGAGSITFRSPEILFTETRISSDNFGDGSGGMVLVEAGTLVMDGAAITVEAYGAPGERLGLIRLKATGILELFNTDVTSNTNSRAKGGTVLIEGRDVRLEDSRVRSDTIGREDGAAGLVSVKADTLLVRNGTVSSNSNSFGVGGDVALEARTITLDTAAGVRSDAVAFGDAGQVTVKAGTLTILESAAITSRAQGGTGNAGTVSIDADKITLIDGKISSGTTGFGDAGLVKIRVGELLLDSERRDTTFITSETLGAGSAGGIVIDARSVAVKNGAYISSDTFGEGNAGEVAIRTDGLTLQDGGYVSSDSLGDGKAGNVSIVANAVSVLGNAFDGTYISSDSLGTGNAGTVSIQAKTLLVDGAGFISSEAGLGGDAGDVSIRADTVTLKNFGNIRTRTFSEGRAGNISIVAGTLSLDTAAFISSQAATELTRGNAGVIAIQADKLTVGRMALISTASFGEGNAGEIGIVAKSMTVDGGLISSSAEIGATGAARALRITAGDLSVVNGGTISTVSFNPQPAGLIEITSGSLLVDGAGSLISSENQAGNVRLGAHPGSGGDAGAVFIKTDGLTISNGGGVSTNAFAGAAGEISISIRRPGLFVLEGADSPGVIQTSSGSGTGGRITISDPLAIISNGGSILALGQQRGANVTIQSRYFINSTDRANTVAVDGDIRLETGLYDVSSGIVNRDISVLDASKVLRGQCPAARSTGAVSQLITRPVGPYVREPGFATPPTQPTPGVAGAGACP